MNRRNKTRTFSARREGSDEAGPLELIVEEPLEIRIEDKPYALVMRTPGDETHHAAGFCLGEGIADGPDDFRRIGYDEHQDPNTVNIWLAPERVGKVRHLLERKSFLSRTSCGICGKAMIDDLCLDLEPSDKKLEVDIDDLRRCMDQLSKKQRHYRTTKGSHAALIFDDSLEAISLAEDVGRHNALDKAVGKVMMERRLSSAGVLVLSSRNSHELVQKAARASIPIIVSNSRPTSLAVEMAESLNMTIVFPEKTGELIIVCGDSRIIKAR